MITEVRRLHEETHSISRNIEHVEMDQLLHLVDLREHVVGLLQGWQGEISLEAQQLLREVQACHERIEARMYVLKNEASVALQNLNRSSQQKKTYDQVYKADSYFVDKRK